MRNTNLETKFLPLLRRGLNRQTLVLAEVSGIRDWMRTTRKYWLCIPHEQYILWCLSFESYQVWDYNILTFICGRFKVGTNSLLSEWDSKQFCLGTNQSQYQRRQRRNHCCHPLLTGTQSWDVPGTGMDGEAWNSVAAPLGPVCCVSTWQVSAAPCCFLFLSEFYILKGFSVLTRGMQRAQAAKDQSHLICQDRHCRVFPEATWKTFLVPSTYGKSAR